MVIDPLLTIRYIETDDEMNFLYKWIRFSCVKLFAAGFKKYRRFCCTAKAAVPLELRQHRHDNLVRVQEKCAVPNGLVLYVEQGLIPTL